MKKTICRLQLLTVFAILLLWHPMVMANDFVVHENGNVGIGTILPTAPLDVQSAADNSWATHIINEGTTGAHGLYVNIGAGGGIPFRVDKNGSALLQVNNNGNIGLHTTTPLNPLHFGQDRTSAEAIRMEQIGGAGYSTIGHDGDGPFVKLSGLGDQFTIRRPDDTRALKMNLTTGLTIEGAVVSTQGCSTSDARWKENVEPFPFCSPIKFCAYSEKKPGGRKASIRNETISTFYIDRHHAGIDPVDNNLLGRRLANHRPCSRVQKL